MNCQVAQRRLLSTLDPDRASEEVRAHLAYCGECQEWQAQLIRIERHVPRLPVPRSEVGQRLVRRFADTAPPVAVTSGPSWPIVELASPGFQKNRKLPALAWTRTHARSLAAAAAVLTICSLAAWYLQDLAQRAPSPPPREKADPPPLLGVLIRHNVRLAMANNPADRVAILADVADDLQQEMRWLAREGDPEDLATLARLYDRIVREGIMVQAQGLPAANRRPVLHPVANRLAVAARHAHELMREVSSPAASSLSRVADAALDGQHRLHALEIEGTS
jgi:hypothetical protein